MIQYALLDTAQHVRFRSRLDTAGLTYASLFDGYPEQSLLDIAPLLIESPAGQQQNFIWKQILALGARAPSLSVLTSRLSLQNLADHLRQFHLVKIPDHKEMLLRWYDTRILPAWMEILTPEQRTGFLYSIQTWRYFDRYGQEQHICCTSEDNAEKALTLSPYSLSSPQYEKLITASEPDMVIAQLRRIIHDEIQRVDYVALYPFVQQHTLKSKNYGAFTLDDQVQYVLVALYTSGGHEKHPYFIQRKKDLAQSRDVPTLSDWLQTVPEEIWEIDMPLWHARTTP